MKNFRKKFRYKNSIYYKLPTDIQLRVDIYLYRNTNGDLEYRNLLRYAVNNELKMNFCYNCRDYLKIKNFKIIGKNLVNNWDIILRNIYNDTCILEKYSKNYSDFDTSKFIKIDNQIIVNHWYMKNIISIDRNYDYNSKYIKIQNFRNKYYTFKIKSIDF